MKEAILFKVTSTNYSTSPTGHAKLLSRSQSWTKHVRIVLEKRRRVPGTGDAVRRGASRNPRRDAQGAARRRSTRSRSAPAVLLGEYQKTR